MSSGAGPLTGARPPASPRVAIVSAVRTPIGKFGGNLRQTPATVLGTVAVEAALARARVAPADVPELIFGHCIQAGTGQNPARQVLLGAGIPNSSGAVTVNKVCGSGLKAITFAAAEIRAGDFDLVVAGGMESMDSAPFLLPGQIREGHRLGALPGDDAVLRDSLLDAYGDHDHMGLTGERVAQHFHLTRAEVDAYALRSHQRAADATRGGRFKAETVPVPGDRTHTGKGLESDEGIRPDTSADSLGRLKPVFRPDGILTAGNASQLSDGAAALVLAGEPAIARRGLKPLAWIHSYAVSGVAPEDVMESPIPTVKLHLARTGFTPKDFDRVEHNEAFSSASVVVQRTFGFTDEQFNPNGGAVALGHPIGASGARIVVTLLHELLANEGALGLATLCMGGGNGLSIILDRRGL
ncbi:MAG: thiolase family protein [Thermoplasmata archaeon]